MTPPRLRLLVPVLALLALSACSGGPEAKEDAPVPFPATKTMTHDGAQPVAVVQAWDANWRKHDGVFICAFLTATYQFELVTEATDADLVDKDASCQDAAAALAEESPRSPVKIINVNVALDETSEVTVFRRDGTAEKVTLAQVGQLWLVEGVEDAPDAVLPTE